MRTTNPPSVLYLPANRRGRDFVAGDIHGCFHLLWNALDKAKFDPACDRVFAVGDLVDRGPDSATALTFLRQPWAFSVRGNHEQMLLNPDLDPMDNGAEWWLKLEPERQAEFHQAFTDLPLAIDVGQGDFGIVHADIPHGQSWNAFLNALQDHDSDTVKTALWGRQRLYGSDHSGVGGVGQVYVGHSVVNAPTKLGNVWAIDTGAVYGYLGKIDESVLTVLPVGRAE